MIRLAVIGSRWFGAEVLCRLWDRADVAYAVAPAPDDRLAWTARQRGVRVHHLSERPIDELAAPEVDLLIAAHAHFFVPASLRATAKWSVGYHPSLLPLYRGRRAVEQAVENGDRVTGGTLYHLDDGWDTGPIAYQDWCFVRPGEMAPDLWRRALAPLGLALVERAVDELANEKSMPMVPQMGWRVGAQVWASPPAPGRQSR